MNATENKTAEASAADKKSSGVMVAVLVLLIAVIGLLAMQTMKLQKLRQDVDGLKSGMAGLIPPCGGDVPDSAPGSCAANASASTCTAGPPVPAPPSCGEGLVTGLRKEVAALRTELEALKKNGGTAAAPAAVAPKGEVKETPAPAAGLSREEIQSELDALRKRLDGLKGKVVKQETKIVKETRGMQGRLSDVKKRIDAAEGSVKKLRNTVDEAALPELRKALDELRRGVARVETRTRKLAAETAESGKAVEVIYKQVFYNDPREQQKTGKNVR